MLDLPLAKIEKLKYKKRWFKRKELYCCVLFVARAWRDTK